MTILVQPLMLAIVSVMKTLRTTAITVAFARTAAVVNVKTIHAMVQMISSLDQTSMTGLWTALVELQMDLVLTATNVKDAVNVEQPLICQLLSPVVGEIVVMPISVKLAILVRLEFIPVAAQSALVPHLIMGNLANTVVIPAGLRRPAQAHGIQYLQSLFLSMQCLYMSQLMCLQIKYLHRLQFNLRSLGPKCVH